MDAAASILDIDNEQQSSPVIADHIRAVSFWLLMAWCLPAV
jgi:alanyl-tRNA synthetase